MQLNQTSFKDSSYGKQPVKLQMAAPELTCDGSILQGATLSDKGHIVLAMFFDHVHHDRESVFFCWNSLPLQLGLPQFSVTVLIEFDLVGFFCA